MVSFWPFRGGDDSAASFEKTLSQLSQKITKAASKNDSLRQQQRRYKVLWTLYTSFAYILVALILTLVTGWRTWGAAEYSLVAGGPVLIYGIRSALDAYFNYRTANSQNHLNELYKQREATIERLKTATKYNSTQQLLDKYGGTPQKKEASTQQVKKRKSDGVHSNQSTPQGGRTGFIPPPTANIPGRQSPPGPVTPQGTPLANVTPPHVPPQPPQRGPSAPKEEFAPNAFPAPMIREPQSQYATDGPKWYDRILDVVLGEDETQARNRIVLICKNCRLVNGQAPPGTRTVEEIGRWRCSSCHAWNGVESEEKKMLKEVSGDAASPTPATSPNTPHSAITNAESKPLETADDIRDGGDMDAEFATSDEEGAGSEPTVGGAVDTPPASSTRSKARQRKKS